MKFNNYLNINRFRLLFRQDWLINKKKYGLTLIGLGLTTYLLLFWKLSTSKVLILRDEFQIYSIYRELFYYYMIPVGIVVGMAFPDLTEKIKTTNYLLNPASCFEKFLLQFVIRILLFVPIALGIFWIAMQLAKASLTPEMVILNTEKLFDPSVVPYFEFHDIITFYHQNSDNSKWIVMTFFFYLSYGTYLFAGTTYFKKNALIKTVIASAVLFLISISFSMLLSHLFYPKETIGFDIQLPEFIVIANITNVDFYMSILVLFSWLFFLPFAYFNLKEREV